MPPFRWQKYNKYLILPNLSSIILQICDFVELQAVSDWFTSLMTIMTDDSFLNLRGKEVLVNIYYNIYNTNHKSPLIFNNCHLSLSSIPPPCPESTKRNLRGSKITDSRAVYYVSFEFVIFMLKIAPNRGVKFGGIG